MAKFLIFLQISKKPTGKLGRVPYPITFNNNKKNEVTYIQIFNTRTDVWDLQFTYNKIFQTETSKTLVDNFLNKPYYLSLRYPIH